MLYPTDTVNVPIYPNRLVHGERRIFNIEKLVNAGAVVPINNPLGANQWFIDSVYRFSLQILGDMTAGGVFQIYLGLNGLNYYPYVSIPIVGSLPANVEPTTVQDITLTGFSAKFYLVNSDPANDQTFYGHFSLRGVI